MTFKKSEVEILLEPAKEILVKLGHKIISDWLPVKHSGETGTSHVTYAEDRFVDALSIFCSDPECEMRFDINQSAYGEHSYMMLWHGCGCLGEMKIIRNNNGLPEFSIEKVSSASDKRFVCKKIKAML